ncbi:TolC family protein [Sphingobacterium psychroaquaticum]|uniref:Outer membrane protein TolC n=1 Tax=Sphingobacterium psychroaquaticum TaxID=561061 RepID=A0A1X7HWP4_9SPHI|nr:TolC family protein [Sphingobacterium psychroaquaticum]SMG06001.1 Outer membrane protein TolC [Sphingobacterium psychroaquaticum]
MSFYTPYWVKRIAIASAFLCTATTTLAIDSLRISLDDILAKSLINSTYVEEAHLQLKEKKIQVAQRKMELLPEVSVRASASYATNMPVYDHGLFNKPSQHEVIHYLYDSGADFYLNLYNGHRDRMNIQSAKLEQEMATIDWKASQAKIKMDVCNLYLDLLRCYLHRQLIVTDIHDQKEQLKEVKDRYTAGVVLHSDVLRIELELSKRELLLIQIGNDIQAANRQLQLITGIEEEIVPIARPLDKIRVDYDETIKAAKEQAFIMQKSEQEVQLKKLAVKQAKANYLPKVGLTGTFTFANPQVFLYPYNDSWYNLGIVGLKLNIPVSAIYLNRNVVRAAQVIYDKEEVKHHHEAEILENKLLQAYLDYKLAKEEQTVRLKNVDLAKENARIIKNRYFKSAALVTDLLDADMQYLQTLFEVESSRIAVQKHYYFIEFLKGTI